MSRELINRMRMAAEDLHVMAPSCETVKCLSLGADALEAQQKRIELYEQALKASWPEGAIGDAFDYWNAARKEDV